MHVIFELHTVLYEETASSGNEFKMQIWLIWPSVVQIQTSFGSFVTEWVLAEAHGLGINGDKLFENKTFLAEVSLFVLLFSSSLLKNEDFDFDDMFTSSTNNSNNTSLLAFYEEINFF